MRYFYSFVITLFLFPSLYAQNYLRVSNPDSWGIPVTSEPDWHMYRTHGQFDEVTIVSAPKGIYTEVEVFTTISQGPDASTWTNEFEIVWQFELPGQAIVHDSWLWIGSDIIKADVVDYWTALETYEEIVDRNQDPSFFYRLSDNRYEIRIYPLFEGESRRIKMSFLIPAQWDEEQVTTDLLQNLLQSTIHYPDKVAIGTPINELWQNPTVKVNNTFIPMVDTIVSSNGELLLFVELLGQNFMDADQISLLVDAPLTDNNTFVSTFSEGGEHFYQLAFVPDWETLAQPTPRKSLVLLEYNDFKTDLTQEQLIAHLNTIFSNHFTGIDFLNVAVNTSNGIQYMSNTWWQFEADLFNDHLISLLQSQDETNLEQLLNEGFLWAETQGDVDHIYIIAANDELVYPPAADDAFLNIQNNIPTETLITLLDYQNENLSVLYFNNVQYEGNEYFYDLIAGANPNLEKIVIREMSESFETIMHQLFPSHAFPSGILDYTTNLENGITYQRYNLNSADLNDENKGVILQTGKYLGDFPLTIDANLITADGVFYNTTNTISAQDVLPGDTLMREMWYGPYLRNLEVTAGSDDDRLFIVAQSIEERVLTGLTAFLALEPNQGGEPCIDCLLNNGDDWLTIATEEVFDLSKAEVQVNPNPVTVMANIDLRYPTALNSSEWKASIYDPSGRLVCTLDSPETSENKLSWKWNIDMDINAGIYFCKMESDFANLTAKIIVIPAK